MQSVCTSAIAAAAVISGGDDNGDEEAMDGDGIEDGEASVDPGLGRPRPARLDPLDGGGLELVLERSSVARRICVGDKTDPPNLWSNVSRRSLDAS